MNDPKCIRIQSKGTLIKCLNEALIQTMLNNANNFNNLIKDLSCFFHPYFRPYCGFRKRFKRHIILTEPGRLLLNKMQTSLLYEPCSEKTGLRGFRPGPTQTGLYSHKRWLED